MSKAEELSLDDLLKKHGFTRSNLGGHDIVTGIYSDIKRVVNEYRQSKINELKAEVERLRKLSADNKLMCWLRDKNIINNELDNQDLKNIYITYLSE